MPPKTEGQNNVSNFGKGIRVLEPELFFPYNMPFSSHAQDDPSCQVDYYLLWTANWKLRSIKSRYCDENFVLMSTKANNQNGGSPCRYVSAIYSLKIPPSPIMERVAFLEVLMPTTFLATHKYRPSSAELTLLTARPPSGVGASLNLNNIVTKL